MKPEREKNQSKIVTGQTGSGSHFRLQKILVPVDFSECSKKALQYAVPFCAQFQASLTLLYVIEIPYGNAEVPMIEIDQLEVQMREISESKMSEMLKGDEFRSITVRPIIRMGNPYRETIEIAKEERIDLIILSTHGHSGFSRLIMGSTTERVVRHAPCPVLVVREHEHDFLEESPEMKAP